jgi:putative FmdB family regulatory protein
MPTYEYTCAKCGHTFELFQSITAPHLTVCPKDVCPNKTWGKGKVVRAIGTGAGIIFKGSGFYATDYRSPTYQAAAKSDSTPAAPAKTESKPAAKPETKVAEKPSSPAK